MTRRANKTYRNTAVIGVLAALLLVLWMCPAMAIKAVKSNSRQVETDKTKKNAVKDPDSNTTGTKMLLHDIESRKQENADSSGYDRWIDRNGDGVNDNMESSKNKPAVKTRVKQPEPLPSIQAVPDTQQKKTDDNSDTTKSKRRR
jgi:hypothetical protein